MQTLLFPIKLDAILPLSDERRAMKNLFAFAVILFILIVLKVFFIFTLLQPSSSPTINILFNITKKMFRVSFCFQPKIN